MAKPEREMLGHCECPVCHSTAARVGLSAKVLAYVTCDACQSQVFARSGKSDELLRDRIKRKPEPVQVMEVTPLPAPAEPTPKPAPKPEPARPGWGFF